MKCFKFVWMVVPLFMLVANGWSQDEQEQDFKAQLEVIRESIQQWAETEQLISKERKDWKLGKDMLEGRIDLVKNEIGSRKESIEEAKELITDADKKREDLVKRQEQLKEASSQVTKEITSLETVVKTKLLPQLPTPLSEKLEPLIQKIPAKPEETKLSLSMRFGNIIGILNEINKFNRDFHVVNEIREFEAGKRAEVKTLYLGIGQGYYVSNDGKKAGVGWPEGASGWKWQSVDASAASIDQAIKVLEGQEQATFVSIPAEIH